MNDKFLTQSIQIQNIIKSFNLTKSLFVSSIIIGEPHTGKKSLIRHLFPTAAYVDGNDQEKVEQFLEKNDVLIIGNFEKLSNTETINFNNKRIIALANYMSNEKTIDNLFAFIYEMPSLRERPEDIKLLAEHFAREVRKNLMMDEEFPLDLSRLDISSNNHSLRKSIYKQGFNYAFDVAEIEEVLHAYLYKNMGGNNDYKEYLPIFEKPLIEAGLKKFGSQLKLSDILGINRNTLRKKIYELGID